ncbi:hypothetical protein B0H21DRAFT_705581 [Amylocystis lapponica]|nr:hypothetical protein B0H21DRAFT_705581 [Amylocystis lapponica]
MSAHGCKTSIRLTWCMPLIPDNLVDYRMPEDYLAAYSVYDVLASTYEDMFERRNSIGLDHVPQRRYTTFGIFTPRPYMEFRLNNNQYLNLGKALTGDLEGLEGHNTFAFPGIESMKLSFRLEWPGPSEEFFSYHRQFNARDSTKHANSITVGKLVQTIAKEVAAFIEGRSNYPIYEYKWQVGRGHIDINCLVLLGLEHVSRGSVQPVLAVIR